MTISKDQLFAQLAAMDRRYADLEARLAQQAGQGDPQDYRELSKELTQLRDVVLGYRTHQRIGQNI